MSFVLTVVSDVACPDSGVATMTSSAKLTVSGHKVVVAQDLRAAAIGGCKQVPPPQSNVACLTVAKVTSGEATKLTVGGKAVLLDSVQAVASGAPKNALTCKDPKQQKLTAK